MYPIASGHSIGDAGRKNFIALHKEPEPVGAETVQPDRVGPIYIYRAKCNYIYCCAGCWPLGAPLKAVLFIHTYIHILCTSGSSGCAALLALHKEPEPVGAEAVHLSLPFIKSRNQWEQRLCTPPCPSERAGTSGGGGGAACLALQHEHK